MSDLEWKIIYVGSASTEDHDQVLDSVLVGPIPMGSHKFVFQVCGLKVGTRCIYIKQYQHVSLYCFP